MMEGLSSFIEQSYGIQGQLTQIEGYDNVNFRLKSKDGNFVVKCFSPGSMELEDVVRILTTLEDKVSVCEFPKVIESLDGRPISQFGDENVLILSWIPGSFMKDNAFQAEWAYKLGKALGALNQVLADVSVPGLIKSTSAWDLQNFHQSAPLSDTIANPRYRLLVDYFFSQGEARLKDWMMLPKTLIHGDANDWNTLVDGGEIKGLIDFGDACYSWRINELAIAGAYLLSLSDDPLLALKDLVKGYHEILRLDPEELRALYYLTALRACVSVCHSSASSGENDYVAVSQKQLFDFLEIWIQVNPLKVEMELLSTCGYSVGKKTADNLLEIRKDHFSSAMSLSYNEPIAMKSAALQYMYGYDGETYLDCVNNICHVGHCNPQVTRAIGKQIHQLNTNTRYLYPQLTEYSTQLLAQFDDHLDHLFLVNSGSAASDLALRMISAYSGLSSVACLAHGYHGNTKSEIDVSSYKYSGRGGEGKPEHVVEIPISGDLETVRSILPQHIGGFIAEYIVGCGGQVAVDAEYLQIIHQEIRSRGGICVADEVQTGFGRVGEAMWSYELAGVKPDVVIIGKPMGNGHPLAGVVCTSEVARAFETGMEFFSSFGGNPVSCAVGLAVLDSLERYELQKAAKENGHYFKSRLADLASKFEMISDVRGNGLFLGVEFTNKQGNPMTQAVRRIVNEMRQKGVLFSSDGPHNNVIKIKPPLAISIQDIDEVCRLLGEVVENEMSKA